MLTVAVLPVKRFSDAKQRLGAAVGDSLRAQLARAMVGDVLTALRGCEAVDATIVVTGEPSVAAAARYVGAIVLQDTTQSGQSAAVKIGLEHAIDLGADRALCIPGDCPALDPDELTELLCGAHEYGHSSYGVVIVPDRHGTGTNGLLLAPPDAMEPSFGPDSRARHEARARAAGVQVRVEQLGSLLLDVDTGEDLEALRERLAGERVRAARTRAVLERWAAAASVSLSPAAPRSPADSMRDPQAA